MIGIQKFRILQISRILKMKTNLCSFHQLDRHHLLCNQVRLLLLKSHLWIQLKTSPTPTKIRTRIVPENSPYMHDISFNGFWGLFGSPLFLVTKKSPESHWRHIITWWNMQKSDLSPKSEMISNLLDIWTIFFIFQWKIHFISKNPKNLLSKILHVTVKSSQMHKKTYREGRHS